MGEIRRAIPSRILECVAKLPEAGPDRGQPTGAQAHKLGYSGSSGSTPLAHSSMCYWSSRLCCSSLGWSADERVLG